MIFTLYRIIMMYIKGLNKEKTTNLNSTGIFSSTLWFSIYNNSDLLLFGIFNKNNELIGYFYYQKHKRAKILTHISPPFLSPHCGLFIKNETSNPANKNTFSKKINEVILEHLKKEKFDILTLPFPNNFMDMQSFQWSGLQVSPKYTYQLNLANTEEDLLSSMSSERRKNITKSKKEGLVLKDSLGCAKSQQLIEQTFTKQGLWYDKKVLENVFAKFNTSESAIAYSTYENENLLATVFCVRDKEKAYYILGGFDSATKHSGAGAFAMWHAIKKAKELGCKIFDFEGSMHPPIEKYFRGFGGEMIPFFSVEKANIKGKTLLKLRGK